MEDSRCAPSVHRSLPNHCVHVAGGQLPGTAGAEGTREGRGRGVGGEGWLTSSRQHCTLTHKRRWARGNRLGRRHLDNNAYVVLGDSLKPPQFLYQWTGLPRSQAQNEAMRTSAWFGPHLRILRRGEGRESVKASKRSVFAHLLPTKNF